jgi:hypothetical protein
LNELFAADRFAVDQISFCGSKQTNTLQAQPPADTGTFKLICKQ